MIKALIVQGGGFRTAFTAGILDAFMALNYNPFDGYLGVSGGSIALSYYLSEQYGDCHTAMQFLASDPEFVKFTRLMSGSGYMNIDYLETVAAEHVPFDLKQAIKNREGKEVIFIATNKETGAAEYLDPFPEDWVDVVVASCTLPFVTKGSHEVRGMDLMDGGWGDPLPVQWAVAKGAEEILVLRTAPKDQKLVQTWPDYLGSLYFRSNEALSSCFANNHTIYNDSIDFMNNPPEGVKITQLSPEEPLKCSTYSYSKEGILADYRYGFHVGIEFVRGLNPSEIREK